MLWAVMVWGELVVPGSCTPKNSEARSSVRAGPCRKILTPSSTGSGIAKSILPSALKSPAAIPAGKARVPTRKLLPNVPSPLPKRKASAAFAMLKLTTLAVRKSRLPSALKSATVTWSKSPDVRCMNVSRSVLGPNVPSPFPRRMGDRTCRRHCQAELKRRRIAGPAPRCPLCRPR